MRAGREDGMASLWGKLADWSKLSPEGVALRRPGCRPLH